MDVAPVVNLADRLASRAEQRRHQTLVSIARSLNALRMSAENALVMGDREASIALRALATCLDYEQSRADTLADEYRELADAAPDEGSE